MGIAIMSGITSVDYILFGMQFLELFGSYECKSNSESKWKSCTRDDVCLIQSKQQVVSDLNYIEIRRNTSDPMYLDNWVDKL